MKEKRQENKSCASYIYYLEFKESIFCLFTAIILIFFFYFKQFRLEVTSGGHLVQHHLAK